MDLLLRVDPGASGRTSQPIYTCLFLEVCGSWLPFELRPQLLSDDMIQSFTYEHLEFYASYLFLSKLTARGSREC